MKYLIGIDGGGTNSRLLASGSNGEVLGYCVGKSTNVESNSVECVLANLKEIVEQFLAESGCSLRATGANAAMARAQGINTSLAKVLGLMISNGLVALSGALLAQYQGFSDINMGRGAI
ncbi:MAG: hypothetical protein UD575_05050, partial [Oscillospiraceae bacterium]|nr:hypothetical protein [Oscillospiraceae bacterium]